MRPFIATLLTMAKNHIEIRLGKIEDKFPEDNAVINFQDIISSGEFNAIKKALNEINNVKSNKRLIDIVILNNAELHYFLFDSFKSLLNKSISWASIKSDEMEEIYLHSNRLLLNYLSSIRTYIDHSLAFLSATYGKDSKELTRFKELLSYNFDNNFCYRFFYKLRNYSQHCGVPIDSISFKTNYHKETNEIEGHLTVLFDPEKMLLKYDGWGALVKADLQKSNEAIELNELRESMTAIMFNVNVNFQKINYPKTIKAAKYLFNKVKHLINGEDQICIFYNIRTRDNGEIINFENIPIPMNEVRELLTKKDFNRQYI